MYRGNSSMSYVDYINHSDNISIYVKALTLDPNVEIMMLHILKIDHSQFLEDFATFI